MWGEWGTLCHFAVFACNRIKRLETSYSDGPRSPPPLTYTSDNAFHPCTQTRHLACGSVSISCGNGARHHPPPPTPDSATTFYYILRRPPAQRRGRALHTRCMLVGALLLCCKFRRRHLLTVRLPDGRRRAKPSHRTSGPWS